LGGGAIKVIALTDEEVFNESWKEEVHSQLWPSCSDIIFFCPAYSIFDP